MTKENELGRFLRSRRARLTPEAAGLPSGSRRRVAGLRREEVAGRAGISVEYYIRLEQGRTRRPSDAVVDTLAGALLLDDAERRHLVDLTRPRTPVPRAAPTQRPRPELVRLVGLLDRIPALVLDHRMDVLAWNHLSAQLFFDFAAADPHDRNLARFAFLDETSRARFPDWHDVARATVGQLRLAAGRHPGDEVLTALIGELNTGSPIFGRLWAGRDVEQRTHGVKRFRHPLAGELTLRFENFDVCGDSGQRLVTFLPEPGGPALPAPAMPGPSVGGRQADREGVLQVVPGVRAEGDV